MSHSTIRSDFKATPASSPAQETFPTYFKGSSAVWVGSRYNLTFMLDSRGRVTMYNSFLNNSGFVLINSPDHALKSMISNDFLYVLVRSKSSQTTSFIRFKLSDLQVSLFCPERLLEQLQVTYEKILEVNERDLLVILINGAFLQVWSLAEVALVQQFSYSPELKFRYCDGILVFFQQNLKKTFFGVLRDGELKSFSFNSDQEIYFCEIAQGKVVVGMKGCHLQVVDLSNFEIEVFQKGIPKQVFYLPLHDEVLAFFSNEEVFIIGQETTSLQLKGRDFACSETESDLLLTSSDGYSYLNFDPITILPSGKHIISTGINPDTRQIICAEKGQMHICD
jgi:hypothetical protein